jgi:GNAT superfamily N-acetyltransferase
MSKRRILTAREQYELLNPWRIAASTMAPPRNEALPADWEDTMAADLTTMKPKQPQLFSPEEGEVGSVQDVLSEWSQKRSDPQAPPGPREPIAPWANKLEQSLYKEFMEDWWPNSPISKERLPEDQNTGWKAKPHEPITHWLNVEDFLKERYPEAATGSYYGLEDADKILDIGQQRGWDVPQEVLERSGYTGAGNVLTQAMLNLHNKLQGRAWATESDKHRYYELMLKHIGPGARRLSKLLRTAYRIAGPADETLNSWTQTRDEDFGSNLPSVYGVKCPTCSGKGCHGCGFIGKVFSNDFQPKESPVKEKVKPWANKLEQQLYGEFMDWWPESEANKTRSPESVNTGWSRFPKEPITHWLNVEDFMQDRYPDAATGASLGLEEAKPLLKRTIENNPMTPEEMEQHGYVGHGNVVTQAFLNLHNKLQGRIYDNLHDQRRYYEFMLRHIGPSARRLSRLLRTAYYDDGPYWAMAWDGWEDDDDDDDEEEKPRKKTSATEELGDCYEAAARYMMDHALTPMFKDRNNNLRLVHGEVAMQGRHTGKTMGHAWIEDGDTVIDQSNGRDIRLPKNVYYNLGKINQLNNFHSYEPEEARKHLIDLQHYGPWHLTVNGEAPPGRVELADDDDEYEDDEYEDDHRFGTRFWTAMSPAEDAYDQKPNEYQRSQKEMPLRQNTSGKWYHVSPHKMEPDTILSPGGGASPYNSDNTTQRQKDWVWMDGPDAVKQWYYGTLLGQVQQGHENPWAHIYEVEPSEGPHPWNGSGQDGHVAPSARIVREVDTDKYNRLPDHLGSQRFWASESQPWVHASPYELPVGTKLVPGGGKGGKEQGMYVPGSGMEGHENHVWMAPAGWDMFQQYDPQIRPYVYEVEPEGEPEKVDDWGWRAPSATITKLRSGEGDTDGTMTNDAFLELNKDVIEWQKNNPPETEEQMIARMKQEWLDKFGTYPDGSKPVTAQRFWAMADTTKWHPMIKHDGPGFASKMGLYHISIPDKMNPTGRRIGDLSYTKYTKGENHYAKDDKDGRWRYMPRPHSEAYIDSLIVHPDFQGQGIAQALVERLAQDHPEHKINPGATTQSGNDFTERLRKIIPEANDRLVPNYDPVILDESDTEDYTQSELSRLVNARRFWRKADAQ